MNQQEMQFEEHKNFKTTLQVVTALCFIATGFLGLQTIASGFTLLTVICLFGGTLFSAAMFVLASQNNLKLPRHLMPPVTFIITIFIVMIGDGIRDEGVLGFILVVALAGLLIGKFGVIVYTAAGLLAINIIGLSQFNGWYPQITVLALSPSRIVIMAIAFVFISAVIYITIANLERALEQVHEREAALEESNQALLNIQAGLEQRIAERIRNLNAAREEAEAAKEEIELQIWQTTGLASLGEVIRGEQQISELATNVIQHLCTYLDAQVGALYLLDEEDTLQQTGSYAISGNQQTSFKLGEGIVGQAAKDKKNILLRDIPKQAIQPTAVRITSSLSDMPPNNLIAVPLVFADSVLGVFEIGSLRPFDQVQLQFLENATESICIAFHTAQTRLQMSSLLVQSRAQAEELKVQGEELRTINDELKAQAENLRAANHALQAQAERLRLYEHQAD